MSAPPSPGFFDGDNFPPDFFDGEDGKVFKKFCEENLAEAIARAQERAPIIAELTARNAPREEWEAALGITFPPVIRDPDGPVGERRFHSSTSTSIWIPVKKGKAG
jgi:hypothetical protein